ncbi:MAG: hypothetical protein MUO62_01330 [Anaerolineales bacterium]|nr:hypothetical protein [Anaerolineales bacterium]
MNDLELSTQAKIQCLDGLGGQVIYLLVNHITNEITHLVIRVERPAHIERLVPISLVSQSSVDVVQLHCTLSELDGLEPYNFVEFIDAQVDPSDEESSFGRTLHQILAGQQSKANRFRLMSWPSVREPK